MILFDHESKKVNEDMFIAICWIGYNVSDNDLTACADLEERFKNAGFLNENDSLTR